LNGGLFLVLVAAVLLAWWLLSLAWHPYAACRKCRDRRGRNVGSKASRWGTCGACRGSGRRNRFGAATVRKGIRRPL
jgi:uncharacterized membrane-anchored protein